MYLASRSARAQAAFGVRFAKSSRFLGRNRNGSVPALTHTQSTQNLSNMLRIATTRLATSTRMLGSTTALSRSYHENVVDHYEKPRNVGSFDKEDPNVGTGLVGAPACGDVMKFQIRVNDEGEVVDSCFKTFGCGSAIASSSLATEWVKGKTVDEALEIKNNQIAKHLRLPPVKLHCSMLAEDAIKSAVEDWKSKKNKQMKAD